MNITTNDVDFVPRNFVIYMFYGEKTCFCWNADKLLIFPYGDKNKPSGRVLAAPAPIKKVQCYDSRIFLICSPHGIYKLSQDKQFAVLSRSALGMGTVFYEVLTPRDGHICLDNKQEKTSRTLFQFSSDESKELHTYSLNVENAEEEFLKVLAGDSIGNLCIIGNGKNLYTLVKEVVQIVYSNSHAIKNIIPIKRDCKVAGLLILTVSNDMLMMYCKEGKLAFENVNLGRNVTAICMSLSEKMRDTFWIVYSDESNLYYAKKQMSVEVTRQVNVQNKSFACLQCYDSKVVSGLTSDMQLVEFSMDTVEEALSVENDTFISLNSEMLKGTDIIMDQIYKGTQELQVLNETLLAEGNRLKMINLYSQRKKIRGLPKMTVQRLANFLFLSVTFHDMLPKHSNVIVSLESEYRTIFCMKRVEDSETAVELHIPEYRSLKSAEISIDLVTQLNEGTPWCLMRNCVNDPLPEKNKKARSKTDRSNFINAKITALRNFIAEDSTDMKKLIEIKKSIRKEFADV